MTWAGPDHLWYARYAGTGTAIGELWEGDAFVGPDLTKPSVDIAGDGTAFSTHQAHALPPELARLDPATSEWTRLTGFNDAIVAGRTFPDVRHVTCAAPDDGVEIEASVITPHGSTGPWPLIVAVHGGPTWNWNAYFSDSEPNAVLLADAGYAVLQPNPRGSSGRGHAFAEQLLGDLASSRRPGILQAPWDEIGGPYDERSPVKPRAQRENPDPGHRRRARSVYAGGARRAPVWRPRGRLRNGAGGAPR